MCESLSLDVASDRERLWARVLANFPKEILLDRIDKEIVLDETMTGHAYRVGSVVGIALSVLETA